MIASVSGVLQSIRETSVVVRVGGIGLEISVPVGVFTTWARSASRSSC
jgi:Holliday junction resolvasome RuvABC DNA-binding subunit